jgi:hypothetical protein
LSYGAGVVGVKVGQYQCGQLVDFQGVQAAGHVALWRSGID